MASDGGRIGSIICQKPVRDKSQTYLIINSVLVGTSTILVGLRFYSRFLMRCKVGFDDLVLGGVLVSASLNFHGTAVHILNRDLTGLSTQLASNSVCHL